MFRIEFDAKTKADAHAALDLAAKAEEAKAAKLAEVKASNSIKDNPTQPLPFEEKDIAPASAFALAGVAVDVLPVPDGVGLRFAIEGQLTEGHGGSISLSIRTALV